jgi:hypothetical protein
MALRPATDGPSMSLCYPVKRCRRRVEFIEFSAPNPSRCQEAPYSFALWGAREFGHCPALRRTHDRVRGNCTAGACPVLNNERLAEPLR